MAFWQKGTNDREITEERKGGWASAHAGKEVRDGPRKREKAGKREKGAGSAGLKEKDTGQEKGIEPERIF